MIPGLAGTSLADAGEVAHEPLGVMTQLVHQATRVIRVFDLATERGPRQQMSEVAKPRSLGTMQEITHPRSLLTPGGQR